MTERAYSLGSEVGMYGDGSVYRRGRKWWIVYWRGGKRFREVGGADEKAARKKLRVRLSQLHGGRFVGPAAEKITVDRVLRDLLEHLAVKGARSVRAYRYHLKPVREALGTIRCHALTSQDVETYQKERLEAGRAPATVNREVEALKQAFNLAFRRGTIATKLYAPLLYVENARQGFMTAAELEAVCSHLPWHIAEAARFAHATGWRKGEVLPLRWDQIDRTGGEVRLATSKNRRPRVVPIAGELEGIIARCWRRRDFTSYGMEHISEFVFHRLGRPVKDIAKPWQRACQASNVTGRLFHDLRRSAVKDMADAGADQATIMAITGHVTDSMFRRYRIVTQDRMREALEAVARREPRAPGQVLRMKTATKPPQSAGSRRRK